MNIYLNSLKRIGISLVIIAVLEAVIELSIYYSFFPIDSELVHYMQTPAGICAKNIMGLVTGIGSLRVYRRRKYSAWIVAAGFIMTIVAAVVIITTMKGTLQRRINGFIDITWILMIISVYTIWQLGRAEREWKSVSSREAAELVLRFSSGSQWFDPFEIGPELVLNRDIAAVIDRYILTLVNESPLVITVQCPETITDLMKDTFTEVLVSYYEGEEHRIESYISRRFDRMMKLVIISVVCIMAGANIFLADSANLVQTALCAFLGFTFAQLGVTFYEISDGHRELIHKHIAGMAKVDFL